MMDDDDDDDDDDDEDDDDDDDDDDGWWWWTQHTVTLDVMSAYLITLTGCVAMAPAAHAIMDPLMMIDHIGAIGQKAFYLVIPEKEIIDKCKDIQRDLRYVWGMCTIHHRVVLIQ